MSNQRNLKLTKICILAGIILILAFMLSACNLFQTVEEVEKGTTPPPPFVDAGGSDDSPDRKPTDNVEWLDEYVNLTVECTSLIPTEIYNKIPKNYKKYVPMDGYIIKDYSVRLAKKDTAYSVLVRGCNMKNIDIRASYSAMYGSYYVESINYIAEKMMDKITNHYSGWIYKVNGVAPNYGMSSYDVIKDDNIVLSYVC